MERLEKKRGGLRSSATTELVVQGGKYMDTDTHVTNCPAKMQREREKRRRKLIEKQSKSSEQAQTLL